MATARVLAAAVVLLCPASVVPAPYVVQTFPYVVQAFRPAFPPSVVPASSPALQSPLGIGRPPTADEIATLDAAILPDGRGLPPGSGTVPRGREIYARACAACHGATGTEGPADLLAGGQGSLTTPRPRKTVGSYWPYATTLWDYIRRAMPYERPGSLSTDEVYAVTAFVLHLNGLVPETGGLTRDTLPAVKMPNREGFIQ